jgi:hypothetical protein
MTAAEAILVLEAITAIAMVAVVFVRLFATQNTKNYLSGIRHRLFDGYHHGPTL